MVRSAGPGRVSTVVGSAATLFDVLSSPLTLTRAVLVTLLAVAATATVFGATGDGLPSASGSRRVQLTSWPLTLHVQPEPVAAVGVRPAGRVSDTVTLELVVVSPTFFTVIRYVPVLAGTKFPSWLFEMARSVFAAGAVTLDSCIRRPVVSESSSLGSGFDVDPSPEPTLDTTNGSEDRRV